VRFAVLVAAILVEPVLSVALLLRCSLLVPSSSPPFPGRRRSSWSRCAGGLGPRCMRLPGLGPRPSKTTAARIC